MRRVSDHIHPGNPARKPAVLRHIAPHRSHIAPLVAMAFMAFSTAVMPAWAEHTAFRGAHTNSVHTVR